MKVNFYSSADFFDEGANFRILKASFLDCPMHYHDFVEFAYVHSGSAIHIIDGKSYEIRKGDLFIMNTNTPHEIAPSERQDGNFVVINCIFKPEFIDGALMDGDDFVRQAHLFFFNHLSKEPSHFGFIQILGEETRQFESLISDMYSEYLVKADGYEAIIRSYLTAMIIKIFRSYQAEHTQNQSLRTIRNQMVENVAAYIAGHYAENLTLEELAGKAFLSPTYFSKVFKECTGQTITQFIRSRRIDAACALLLGGQLPVAGIAERVGYQDVSSFYEAFRKATGLSPKQYIAEKARTE